MSLLFKDHLTSRLRQLCNGARPPCASEPAPSALSTDDIQFMERIADALVKRGMGAPAALFLQSMGPMNFLGSQALHVLTAIIECALDGKDMERLARPLARRGVFSRLITLIETKRSMQRASAR